METKDVLRNSARGLPDVRSKLLIQKNASRSSCHNILIAHKQVATFLHIDDFEVPGFWQHVHHHCRCQRNVFLCHICNPPKFRHIWLQLPCGHTDLMPAKPNTFIFVLLTYRMFLVCCPTHSLTGTCLDVYLCKCLTAPSNRDADISKRPSII